MARRVEDVVFVGLSILLAFWALATLSWPFGWDQGLFAWVGDVVSRGGLPYRDAWDLKGPAVHYTFAAAQWVFGAHSWSIRVFDLFGLTVAVWVLFRVLRDLDSNTAARYGAMLFVLWFASGSYWHTAQPDGWIAMLTIVACGPLLAARAPRWFYYAFAGMVIGVISLYKFPYLVLGAVVIADIWIRSGPWTRRVGLSAVVGVGWLAPIAVAVWWFAAHGGLVELYEVTLVYPMEVYASAELGGLSQRVRGLVEHVLTGPVAVMVLPILPLGLYASWRLDRRATVVLTIWLAVSMAVVMLQGRFFLYHWLPTLPPMVILAAIGIARVVAELREVDRSAVPGIRWLAAGVGLMLLGHTIVRPTVETGRWLAWSVGAISRDQYEAGFGSPAEDLAVARYLREHSEPSDGVVIWGWNSAVLFLSQRISPTRFGYSMPLMMGDGHPIQERYRTEFLCALEDSPPRYIVVGSLSTQILHGTYHLEDFPAFHRMVKEAFVPIETFGSLRLYERFGETSLDPSPCDAIANRP